jgi:hypothetical protein
MDLLLSVLLETVIKVVIVGTGRLLVTVLSFGRWRSASFFTDEEKTHGGAGVLSFVQDGQRVATTTSLVILGLVFYFVLASIFVILAACL